MTVDNTALNPLEVLSGKDYSLPEDPKILRVLIVQMARVVAGQILSRSDEYSEKVAAFLERLSPESIGLFHEKFRLNVDRSLERLEAEIAVKSKQRRDWTNSLANSRSSVKFLETLKGLRKRDKE